MNVFPEIVAKAVAEHLRGLTNHIQSAQVEAIIYGPGILHGYAVKIQLKQPAPAMEGYFESYEEPETDGFESEFTFRFTHEAPR